MPDRERMVNAIEAYCQAESSGDRAAFMALFSPEVVHEDPVGVAGARREGMDGLAELWELGAQSRVRLWPTDKVIVCGNEAIAMMACEVGPDDARMKLGPIVDHFIFDEAGKITRVRAFYDYG